MVRLAALLALMLAVPGAALAAETAEGSVTNRGENFRGPTLQERLEKGLKARRPSEFAFLANVAKRVEEGSLPRSLVDSTFFWARNKRPYPFPYFERGLKERAKKLGLTI
ncbi:MAG TPA: hypothetical protein VNQ74_12560 [Burkholderiaceae bacterium]|nr:hypothetical protein [Burkholderiaceae bacterium]